MKVIANFAITLVLVVLFMTLILTNLYRANVSDALIGDPTSITVTTGDVNDEEDTDTPIVDDKNEKEKEKEDVPTTLTDNPVPLAMPHRVLTWSLLSLIMGIISLLLSMLIVMVRGSSHDDAFDINVSYTPAQLRAKNRRFLFKVVTIGFGVLPLSIFFTMEQIAEEKMTMVDENTPLIAVIFLIHLGMIGLLFLTNKSIHEPAAKSVG